MLWPTLDAHTSQSCRWGFSSLSIPMASAFGKQSSGAVDKGATDCHLSHVAVGHSELHHGHAPEFLPSHNPLALHASCCMLPYAISIAVSAMLLDDILCCHRSCAGPVAALWVMDLRGQWTRRMQRHRQPSMQWQAPPCGSSLKLCPEACSQCLAGRS